jgi:4,5-dihydroxyphthalate decarboxylase
MCALRTSLVPSPLTQGFIDGTFKPREVDLDIQDNNGKTTSQIIEENSKRMVAVDLDVAEMSFGTYARARDLGVPILALPCFPGRRFLQPAIIVRADSPIQDPKELKGKKAAIGQFWMTAFVWHRTILNSQYGVKQNDVSWVTTQPERWDQLPTPQADVQRDTSGREPLELLKAGEVDVALLSNANGLRGDGSDQGVRRLFAEPAKIQLQYYRRTGVFPIIHLVVAKEEIAQDRYTYDELTEALRDSKQAGLNDMIESPTEGPVFGAKPEEVRGTFGHDPYPYGVEANRQTIELLLGDAANNQHLTDRQLAIEELFPSHLLAR